VLFGVGPMRMWPWLELERGRPGEQFDGPLQYDGPWGAVIYHAHSTYLELLVEYGIVGLALLVVVLVLVVRRCILEIRQGGQLELVAVAVLLALPAMLVETYLVRGFPSALLFWCAVLVVGPGFEAPSSHLNQRGPQGPGLVSRLLRRPSTPDDT
jgi:O-antigen ligase